LGEIRELYETQADRAKACEARADAPSMCAVLSTSVAIVLCLANPAAPPLVLLATMLLDAVFLHVETAGLVESSFLSIRASMVALLKAAAAQRENELTISLTGATDPVSCCRTWGCGLHVHPAMAYSPHVFVTVYVPVGGLADKARFTDASRTVASEVCDSARDPWSNCRTRSARHEWPSVRRRPSRCCVGTELCQPCCSLDVGDRNHVERLRPVVGGP